jgi:hypothetical protein
MTINNMGMNSEKLRVELSGVWGDGRVGEMNIWVEKYVNEFWFIVVSAGYG